MPSSVVATSASPVAKKSNEFTGEGAYNRVINIAMDSKSCLGKE